MSNLPDPRTVELLQLIPAAGWRWRFGADRGTYPLTALVLVERDYGEGWPVEQRVEGVDLSADCDHGLVEDLARDLSDRDGSHRIVEYVAPCAVPAPSPLPSSS